jgi:ribose transport system substrate-binding protein
MVRNRKLLGILGLIAVFSMVLSACVAPVPAAAPAAEAPAAEAPAEGEAAAEGEAVDVALIYGVAGDGFYVTMEAGARAKAEELGVNFTAQGPAEFNATLQRPIIDAVIANQPDAICVAVTDKTALTEPLKAASDAGIHIFSVDTFMGENAGDYTSGDVTFPLSYIGSNNVEGGKIACEAVIEAMGGTGKMYIQNVRPGISTTDQREQGCREAIEATGGAVELVGVDYNEDSAALAAEQTAALLQRVPDLGGVFGANLFSAEGAATAVKNAGLTGVVKIAAFDAPEAAIEDLRNNVVDLVIAQLPYEMGQKCIEFSVAAVNGDMESIDKRWPTGYQVITRENVDTEESQNAIYKSE